MSDLPYLGLGTYRLKNNIAYNITLEALKNGYRHIDTAKLYNNENEIGRAIKDSNINRKEIFITTKVWIKDIENDNIIDAILTSLEKLQTDYIDMVLLHAPLDDKITTSWNTMENIYLGNVDILKNKVRFIGVSNYDINHLEKIINKCKIKPFVNQIEVSPYLNRNELINYCNSNNINIVAHSSLVKGEKFNDSKLIEMANKLNISPAILLLSWGVSQGLKVIPRTSNTEHLLENKKCINIKLSKEIINQLNQWNENYATHPKYINKN